MVQIPKETVDKMREMAAKGYSAAVIGVAVGRTRNSVIGICRRNGIDLPLKAGGASAEKDLKRACAELGLPLPAKQSPSNRERKPKPAAKHGWKNRPAQRELSAAEQLERREKAKQNFEAHQNKVKAAKKKAAKGALHLPLVSVKKAPVVKWRNRAKHPYRPKHYDVQELKPTREGSPGQCRFPMNDNLPFRFCGKRCQADSRYCPAHHEISYVGTVKLADLVKKAARG